MVELRILFGACAEARSRSAFGCLNPSVHPRIEHFGKMPRARFDLTIDAAPAAVDDVDVDPIVGPSPNSLKEETTCRRSAATAENSSRDSTPSFSRPKISRITQQEVSVKDSRRETCDIWLYSIPIFNLLFDVAGDQTPPSVDQLRDIMTLFGLVGALMLSVVTSLSSVFDYDKLVECRARFSPGGVYHDASAPLQPVDRLLPLITVSFWLFICCAVSTTFFLFALSTGADQLSNFRTRLKWWRSARWAFLLCLIMLIAGAVTTTLAYESFALCTLPDELFEAAAAAQDDEARRGDVEARRGGLSGGSGMSARAWYSYLNICCLALLLLIVLIMGIAHRSLSICACARGLSQSPRSANPLNRPPCLAALAPSANLTMWSAPFRGHMCGQTSPMASSSHGRRSLRRRRRPRSAPVECAHPPPGT